MLSFFLCLSVSYLSLSPCRLAITELVNNNAFPAQTPLEIANADEVVWQDLRTHGVVTIDGGHVGLTEPAVASLQTVASLSGGERFASVTSADLSGSSLMELLLQLEAPCCKQ